MRGEDDPQSCRVDELETLEIEYDQCRVAGFGILDLALQERRAGEIKFSVESQHDPILLGADIDLKVPPSWHTPMLPQGFVCRCASSGRSRACMPSFASPPIRSSIGRFDRQDTKGQQRNVVTQPARSMLGGGVLDVFQQPVERQARRLGA